MGLEICGLEHREWGLTVVPVTAPKVTCIDVDVMSDTDMVEFCGQKFDVCSLLGISQVTYYRPPQVAEFRELVGRLNGVGNAMVALKDSGFSTEDVPPIFFSNGEEHNEFALALQRMTETTSWKLEFLPSPVNPGKGIDVRVIVPE